MNICESKVGERTLLTSCLSHLSKRSRCHRHYSYLNGENDLLIVWDRDQVWTTTLVLHMTVFKKLNWIIWRNGEMASSNGRKVVIRIPGIACITVWWRVDRKAFFRHKLSRSSEMGASDIERSRSYPLLSNVLLRWMNTWYVATRFGSYLDLLGGKKQTGWIWRYAQE